MSTLTFTTEPTFGLHNVSSVDPLRGLECVEVCRLVKSGGGGLGYILWRQPAGYREVVRVQFESKKVPICLLFLGLFKICYSGPAAVPVTFSETFRLEAAPPSATGQEVTLRAREGEGSDHDAFGVFWTSFRELGWKK